MNILKAAWRDLGIKDFYTFEVLFSEDKKPIASIWKADNYKGKFELTFEDYFIESKKIKFNFDTIDECKNKVKFFLKEKNILIADKNTECLW